VVAVSLVNFMNLDEHQLQRLSVFLMP
jgi:hypothetical protein